VRRRDLGFNTAVSAFFVLVMIVMLYPFWHAIVASFMTPAEYYSRTIFLYVSRPTLINYRSIFSDGAVWRPMANTVLITVVGVAASLAFTAWFSYGLSKRFKGSTLIMQLVVLTMIVDPGLIPRYLLYRDLGLINSYGVYILPALTYPFFVIIMRTNFRSMPQELEDAARIDGCSEIAHFMRIALPLSTPMLATIGLFIAVDFWNTLFPSLFFVTKDGLKTLQDFLYRIVTDEFTEGFSSELYFTETVKMANIILTTLPILLVYPFVQGYFIKGMMIGSLKG
jgi:putative aldouronate transport system permease protein